jgi:hypothetical protein
MKDVPSLLVVTNRGRLVAYRISETGQIKLIETFEPAEGNLKISEMVTDQAGAFPTGKSNTSAYESLPLVEEMETRSIRRIAGKISEILQRVKPSSWGFAALPEFNAAVLEHLDPALREVLVCNLRLDLTNSPPATVRSRFELELQLSPSK